MTPAQEFAAALDRQHAHSQRMQTLYLKTARELVLAEQHVQELEDELMTLRRECDAVRGFRSAWDFVQKDNARLITLNYKLNQRVANLEQDLQAAIGMDRSPHPEAGNTPKLKRKL